MSNSLFLAHFYISTKLVYLHHCLVVTWLVPCEMPAISVCSVYIIQPSTMSCHFMQSHIRRVHAYLAGTCCLHFWQIDWDLLHATGVTRGWNRYQNKSRHRKLTLEKKILPPLLRRFEPATFLNESGALTTDTSLPLSVPFCVVEDHTPVAVSAAISGAYLFIAWQRYTFRDR